jgi:hypothetical protein
MKKILISLMMVLTLGRSMAAGLDIDLTATADLASGVYDLDTLYNGVSTIGAGAGNVAGIYQINGESTARNIATIDQSDGVNNFAMIWQGGYDNNALITQAGGENNIVRLVQMGSGHNANLLQSGGSDNVMFVQMLGTGATIKATQNEAFSNQLSVVLNTGSNLDIAQTGTGNVFSTSMASNTSMVVRQTGQ